jgi:hypothetical protein
MGRDNEECSDMKTVYDCEGLATKTSVNVIIASRVWQKWSNWTVEEDLYANNKAVRY